MNQKYNEFIEQKAEQTTIASQEEATKEAEKLVDIRLVPEFIQVEEAVKQIENLEVGDEIYRTKQKIVQSQQTFDIAVNQMAIFEAKSDDQMLGIKSEKSDEGAIVIASVAITNKSPNTFYFPIDELKLTYPNAPASRFATSGLYPLETGNLYQILLNDNHGEISAGTTVEGYLVYSLTKEDLTNIKDQDAFSLTVVPPNAQPDSIIGLSSSDLGYVLPLYLPLNEETEQKLVEKTHRIQDRLSAEWWGEKVILADEVLDEQASDGGVHFTLKRVELSDFTPHENYEESFQYFPNGQVILSLEIEIDNQSEHTLLPIDSLVNLVINGDTIQSDYILINELYGERLAPGEKTTIIKTFALDKYTYQQNWQNQEAQIYIQVTLDESVEATTTITETTSVEMVEEFVTGEEADIVSDTTESLIEGLMFEGNFIWQPKLTHFIDTELKVVDKLVEETEKETTTAEGETTLSDEGNGSMQESASELGVESSVE